MNNEPTLVMLCGPPCSGKSTYVRKLLLENDYGYTNHVVLSTDNYIERMATKLNSTYSQIFEEYVDAASRELDLELKEAIRGNKSIIWDQTNLTAKARKRKLNKIPPYYSKSAAWFLASLETIFSRNENRPGKYIPKSVLRRMHSQFERPTLEEGFDYVVGETN
jgi:tRNA uridine 5-carbamoylmethylation protein Kti12